MKIAVLDGYTLNPGDLSWEPLRQFGEVTVHDRTPEHLAAERAAGAEIVLTNKTPMSAETIGKLPDLRYIGVLATGYNIVDVAAAKARGITVTNIPDYGTAAVAQHTIALLLELCNRIAGHSAAVADGAWTRSPDWCFTVAPLKELFGKRIGIIGHGRIGSQVGRIASAFGMEVLCERRRDPAPASIYGEKYVSREELLSESDVISLHCPLTPETKGLINRETISLMKDGVLILNTSRGPLIEERDLADALRQGKVAGAGLDVLSVEPPGADNPLLGAPNCVITPHIAWAAREARARLFEICLANIRAFLDGNPVNTV